MIQLTYSNRTEGLLEALAADLAEARAAPGASVLAPAVVVVPNRNVEVYLRQGLARLQGIAANLEVHQLRRFVGRLADAALDGARLADADAIRGHLLSILLDERRLASGELAPVREWLGAGGTTPEAVDVRRVALSGQLSRLFEEYAFSRPELLDRWPEGAALGGTPFAEVEAWERRLWLELFGKDGELARLEPQGGERLVPHAALLERLRDRHVKAPPRVHLFGISYVAKLFQQILAGLADRALVRVYTVNPCLEFWEDVQTFRDVRRPLPKRRERLGAALFGMPDPFGLAAPGDNPALVAWGRPGRENVRLLNELSECDFRSEFRDPGEGTLLHRLQRDILLREPERAGPDPLARADGSIRILAVPGVRREAEVIASEIWRLVKEDERSAPPGREPLRFHDIAVLVAGSDPAATFTQLASVFAEMHGIPFSLSDSKMAGESRIAEAIGLLLALPGGRFLRRELLALVTHPAVARRFPDVDPRQWIAWCEELGIVHGADHEDHRDTYLGHDILNWDQGLRRLGLGAFLSGERSGDDRLFAAGGERYLPEEPDSGGTGSAAAFALLVRSLVADARFARNARLPLPDWADFLVSLVRTYVLPGSAAERIELDRCAHVLASLAEIDVEGPVSWTIARELAQESLSGLGGGHGGYLASGVAIAGLQPMRAIPFRVIFIAGLTEGRFPSGDRKNQLDLRQALPRAGDVSPREGDRYLFLETLLSARDALYLSYVARDALTGEELEPSSVVSELLRMLCGYLGVEEARKLVERHPLRRHDPSYFPPLFGEHGEERPAAPDARREVQALALREELGKLAGDQARIPQGEAHGNSRSFGEALSGFSTGATHGQVPSLALLERALPPATFAKIRDRLGVLPRPTGVPAPVGPVRVSLAALRRFLECPLQGDAAFLLGLEAAEEGDALVTEDEPFALPRRDVTSHLRAWFLDAFAAAGRVPADDVLATRCREGAERLALAGRGPSGVFADVERQGLDASLAAWAASLRELDPKAAPPRVIRFGPGDEHAVADRVEDPIVLEVELPSGPVHVEVVGRTEPLLGDAASLTLLRRQKRRTKEWERVRCDRESLRGFLDHVALSAAGISAGGHQAVLLNGQPSSPTKKTISFAPLSVEEARAWLGAVIAELLGRVHAYFLPCEVAFWRELKGVDPLGAVEAVVANEPSHASKYGPVSRPERCPVPPDREVEASLERRFELYFRNTRRRPTATPVSSATASRSG